MGRYGIKFPVFIIVKSLIIVYEKGTGQVYMNIPVCFVEYSKSRISSLSPKIISYLAIFIFMNERITFLG
jgi:hypothetical protein